MVFLSTALLCTIGTVAGVLIVLFCLDWALDPIKPSKWDWQDWD